jgi:ABC-type Fe3+ transport system permease subunit
MPAHGLVSARDANARQEEQTVPAFDALGLADPSALLARRSMSRRAFRGASERVYALPAVVHALANAIMFAKRDFFHVNELTTAIAIVRKAVAA